MQMVFFLYDVFTCVARLPFVVNVLSQSLHVNGFASVWTLICVICLSFVANALPHSVHTNGFATG